MNHDAPTDDLLPPEYSPNECAQILLAPDVLSPSARAHARQIAGASVLDFGIESPGSLTGGLILARVCLGGLATVQLADCDPDRFGVSTCVDVQTDFPLLACLGCQYAGWPVQSDDYFAMGSGPMRLHRGKEPVLVDEKLTDHSDEVACGVLESDSLPTESAIRAIADDCGVSPESIRLGVAPTTSIAGCVQVVSRSAETAMHKLHELKFNVRSVISARGTAPLPPPAASGKTIEGIGRTNDAMLYGANVVFWVDCEDEEIESVIDQVPSESSADYGRPFVKIFADYDNDFYKVDPALFSPAVVTMHNLRSGRTFSRGQLNTDVLRESFGL
jgi:methenyltetrahydromethanopterin cyclohydrolase